MTIISILIIYLFVMCPSKIFAVTNSSANDADAAFMRHAVMLASQAIGTTSPNPCVGCVIVDGNGTIVGEGWHEKAGEPHAEVHALREAGHKAVGSTAYVSLEPCNHFGRTPPCSQALLRYGIRRVVAGMVDPDPRVSGGGLTFLREQGIDVRVGVEEELCKSLNAPFIFRVLYKRSYVVLWLTRDSASAAGAGVGVGPAAFTDTPTNSVDGLDRTHEQQELLREILSFCAPDVDSVLLDSRRIGYLPALRSEAHVKTVFVDALHPDYLNVTAQTALLRQVQDLLDVDRSQLCDCTLPMGGSSRSRSRSVHTAARAFRCVVMFPTSTPSTSALESVGGTTGCWPSSSSSSLSCVFLLEVRHLAFPDAHRGMLSAGASASASFLSRGPDRVRALLEEAARSGSNAVLVVADFGSRIAADFLYENKELHATHLSDTDVDAEAEAEVSVDGPQRLLITERCSFDISDNPGVELPEEIGSILRLLERRRPRNKRPLSPSTVPAIHTNVPENSHQQMIENILDNELESRVWLLLDKRFRVISHKLWVP